MNETAEKTAPATAVVDAQVMTDSAAMVPHTQTSTALAAPLPGFNLTRDQVELLKRTVCIDATDDEFQLFMYQAKRLNLDPFLKQIHAVKRWSSAQGRDVMSIQVGIDGFRLKADETKHYAPGRETTYGYDPSGNLVSATSYVMKYTEIDGKWHEVAATARYSEYVQLKSDGEPNSMWTRMPHVMLAKVAEALALRKSFPATLSGIYTPEEMAQADNEPRDSAPRNPKGPTSNASTGTVDTSKHRKGATYVMDYRVIKKGTGQRGEWILYGATFKKGAKVVKASTFDHKLAAIAEAAFKSGDAVQLTVEDDGKDNKGEPRYKLTKLEPVFFAREEDESGDGASEDDSLSEEEAAAIDAKAATESGDVGDAIEQTKAALQAEIDRIAGKGKAKGKAAKAAKPEPTRDADTAQSAAPDDGQY